MNSIDQVRRKVCELGELVDAPKNLLNIPDRSIGDGSPHVEVTESLYSYVVSERGVERSRRQTTKIDDLLYWIFSDVTSTMSFDYERKNRIADQDSRRLAFEHKLKLLSRLSKSWENNEAEKMKRILEKNPYLDQ